MDDMMHRRIRRLGTQNTPRAACPERTPDWRERGHNRNRRTILIASTNSVFVDTVAGLVAANGFTPAYLTEREEPWLSLMRTQPCIAICDCDAPRDQVQRLLLEAWARHVPLLVSATERFIHAQSLKLRRVARFRLPVSHAAFSEMLDRLLPPAPWGRARRDDERRENRHTTGVGGRTPPIAKRDLSWPENHGPAHHALNAHSDVSDNARADDDGMARPA